MADGVFNIAKGAAAEKIRDAAANVGVMLLKAAEPDADLVDHDDIASLLGAAGNTEADFTNYARKTGLSGSVTVSDGDSAVYADVADQTWSSAGGNTDNNLVKLIVFYDEGGTDATRIPLTHHDFQVGTGGGDLTAQFDTNGFYKAT